MSQGFFLNVISSISIPDFNQNLAVVEVIYDVFLFQGSPPLNRFVFGVFDSRFGKIGAGNIPETSDFVVTRDGVEQGNGNGSLRVIVEGSLVSVRAEFDRGLQPGVSEVKFRFEVPLVCQHSSGEQAIPASFVNLITDIDTRHVGVDFSFPSDVLDRRAGDFTFTPSGQDTQVDANGTTSVFLTFNPDDLNFGLNFPKNIFLFLGENQFEDAPSCVVLNNDNTLFIFLAAVFGLICGCGLLVGLSHKYCDNYTSNTPERRRNQGLANLMNYPGTPDIILQPQEEGRQTLVRAVLEEDDPDDLNAVNPVTTIQVHMNRQATVDSSDL